MITLNPHSDIQVMGTIKNDYQNQLKNLKNDVANRNADVEQAKKDYAAGNIDAAKFEPLGRRHPGPAEADEVQSGERVAVAGNAKRRQILADPRLALHQRQPADANELMDCCVT